MSDAFTLEAARQARFRKTMVRARYAMGQTGRLICGFRHSYLRSVRRRAASAHRQAASAHCRTIVPPGAEAFVNTLLTNGDVIARSSAL